MEADGASAITLTVTTMVTMLITVTLIAITMILMTLLITHIISISAGAARARLRRPSEVLFRRVRRLEVCPHRCALAGGQF